jgi:sulfonate transport system permease protein
LRDLRSSLVRILLGSLLPALLLAAWWWSTEVAHFFTENQLPPPQRLLSALRELNRQGAYSRHLLASLRRVALGFGAGAGTGVVLGTLVGLSKTLERIVDPTLQGLRSVPSLAWVPFLLLWLGIDEGPKITLIAIGAFFPVYINLVSGIRQVDRKLVEVGEIFVLNTCERVVEIFLPAAVPYAMTGLRIGLGQAWLFLVAAELIASTRGLGFLLIDGQNNLRPDLMLVSILTLALLGKSADSLLRLLESKLLGWSDTFGGRR